MATRLTYILDRLPLPSLRTYTFFSLSLLIANVFYYHHLIQSNRFNLSNETNENSTLNITQMPFYSFDYLQTLFVTVISQSLSLLIFINAVFCSSTLIGKQIQMWIFADLRAVEVQRLKDKFWNYAFYKFCFLFGVLGLENLNELVLWISWFSILAFILIFCQLAKDRFELLSISASVRRQSFVKVLGLLSALFVLCFGLFVVCFTIGLSYGGLSIFFFMFAEILLLSFDTFYLLVKYFLQYSLFIQQEQDVHRSAISSNESRSSMIYYFEFIFHISTLIIDILHHLQMLFYHQTFMSMSSLIFFMQLKPLFHELTQRLKKHKSYRMAMLRMEKKYPLLTKYDLEQKYLKQNHRSTLEEICSICWEKFDKARCLPCGHLFHQNCLQSWLEQDTTCPICRLSLHEETTNVAAAPAAAAAAPVPAAGQGNFLNWPQITLARLATNVHENAPPTRRARNHLFRFDGHRYSSWLPSFSIEINHNFPFRLARSRLTGIQLTSMTQSIQQIFPQIPAELILADLQTTQSMDATINNIIDRRIRFDPTVQQQNDGQDPSASDESSYTSTSPSSSDVEDLLESETTNENNRITTTEDDEIFHSENFVWPLNPNLSFAERKQKLIFQMRRRFLENEQRAQISKQKSDLVNEP